MRWSVQKMYVRSKIFGVLAVVIVSLALCCHADDGESGGMDAGLTKGRAYLLIQKRLMPYNFFDLDSAQKALALNNEYQPDNWYFAVGKKFSVLTTIYNVGDGSAYDVKFADGWAADSFRVLNGSLAHHYDTIAAGGSVNHTTLLAPLNDGEIEIVPAKATYAISNANNAAVQNGHSSSYPNVTVLSAARYEKITAKHYREWSIFGGMVLASVFLPMAVFVHIQLNYQHGVPKSALRK